jgi:hypothetical protein
MIRRIALAAVTGALCATLLVDTASAYTRREAICVKGARSRAKLAIRDCRDQAADKLATDLSACLNDTNGCVSGCISDQATCQALQKPTLDTCRNGCKADNALANDNCGNAADPVKCVADAQFVLFTCNQGCAASVQPALIECNGLFNDCLQGCSNP